jgi:hypothetical protein
LWAFYNLLTKARIRRMHWKKMVMAQDIVEKLNALDPDVAVIEPVGGNSNVIMQGDNVNNEAGAENEAGVGEPSETPSENPLASLPDVVIVDVNMPELIDQGDDELDDEPESSDSDDKDNQEILQRSARLMAGVKKPVQFRQVTHTVKLMNGDNNDKQEKEGIEKVQVEEIKLVLDNLKAIEAVKKESIPEGVHNTHLFTVEKFLANGEHDKF